MMIFVLGFARSGTTMMGRILGNHPEIHTFGGEFQFFDKIWNPVDGDDRISRKEALELAGMLMGIDSGGTLFPDDPHNFVTEADRVLQKMNTSAFTPLEVYESVMRHITAEAGKSIPCEQTPQYSFFVREILQFFPDARIVNMVRDPRDVLFSKKRRWRCRFRTQGKYPLRMTLHAIVHYHPIFSSRLWKSAVESVSRVSGDPRVLTVKFEDVLQNPESEIKRLCAFLGLAYDRRMLKVPMVGSSHVNDDFGSLGISQERMQNWKKGGLTSAEIYINQKITSDQMKTFGYQPKKVFPNPLWLTVYLLTLPVKAVLSILFQMKDLKNIKETLKRRLRA